MSLTTVQVGMGGTGVTSSTGSGSVVLSNAPTLTGQATIPTINLTGGQITFPATQVPSADPNTLDDYEEGTWSPLLQGGTSNPSSISYNEQFGSYVKIGKQVTVQFYLATNSYSGGSGDLRIGGLPFTANAGRQPPGSIGAWYFVNFQTAATFPNLGASPGAAQLTSLCFNNNSGWGAPQLTSAWPTGTYAAVQGTVTYFV